MPIQLLADSVISQIAAGEVVERPASVVKELVENALDAGAANIIIEVAEGGRRLIRVSDDGSGIRPDEVKLALARHATSKLQQASDLLRLQTLGFRGEALASIAAVSLLTLVSRQRDEKTGVEVRVEGGTWRARRDVGVPAGTVVTVENLFFNTPARLKFLKTESTERRHIQNLVMDYAMAYTHVRFVLVQDGREVFRSNGTGRLHDVVARVFGLDVFKQMVEVTGEDMLPLGDRLTLRGYVTLPEMNRNDRSRIVLFVNGRAVQDANLVYAITQAYHLLMERGRYPYAILLLTVPTDFVDVNVHPTKAEVRFQDSNIVFVAVQRAVREVLMRTLRNPQQGYGPGARLAGPQIITTNLPEQTSMGFQAEPAQRPRRASSVDEDYAYIPNGAGRPTKPRTLPPLRVLGQIAASYIVAEGPAGLYLVDQFAASERVLYDRLLDEREHLQETAQPVDAVTVQLTTSQMKRMATSAEVMRALGLTWELFGPATYRLHTVPALTAGRDANELAMRLSLAVEQGATSADDLLAVLAAHCAYKTGQKLSQEQMEDVLRLLERASDPFNSPSGRAILIHMSADQLAREFTRRP
jgi:DNA mismatch repair protein MutL